VDDTGLDFIYDGSSDDNYANRFCTLNLVSTMHTHPDAAKNMKPAVIFKATAFCAGEDWTGSDKAGLDAGS
jgi:hypothetical protein